VRPAMLEVYGKWTDAAREREAASFG
jgi:hypothetical protein